MKILLMLFPLWFSFVGAQNFQSSFSNRSLPLPEVNAGPNTTARLIAGSDRFVPGETVTLGLVLEMKAHWHTYWINPGVAGMPTSLELDLPEGFQLGDFQWPTPERFLLEGLVSLGYEDRVVLPVTLITDEDFPLGEVLELKGTASWLECKDVCLPGSQEVSITLTSAESTGEANAELTAAVDALPQKPGWPVNVQEQGDEILLQIDAPAEFGPFVHYFPYVEGAWILEPEPEISAGEEGVSVLLIRDPDSGKTDAEPWGLLVNQAGQGFEIAFAKQAGQVEKATLEEVEVEQRSTWLMLLIAFVAGIGMNLLPCIFPVLGLKISGFVEQAQGDQKSVRRHALVFAAGVIISLWILGAVVGLLGAAWGVQFQNPKVVIGMLLVLTFFTMNLFGIFELGNKLTTVGGGLTQKSGYAGSFFQGILLTVIGTPCTGPVLAGSIVWMLTQPLWIGFLAFTLMGIGMSLPYVVMAYSPKLIEKLPRPGTWMITFKKASAFMIVLFIWGLLYVLKGQISPDALLQVIGGLLLVTFAAWILGTWAAPGRKSTTQQIAWVVTLITLVLASTLALNYHEKSATRDAELQQRIDRGEPIRYSDVTPELAEELLAEGVPLHYRPWSPELVAELQREGKPVFVDFTADWCTICKINKIRALHKEDVMRAFQEKGVVTLRADWTGRDEIIAAELQAYNRQGVPVYQLFRGEPGARAELLPEKLTPAILLEALDNL